MRNFIHTISLEKLCDKHDLSLSDPLINLVTDVMNMTITKTEFLDWWGSDHENVEELTELILELLNKKYKIDTCVQDIKQYKGE